MVSITPHDFKEILFPYIEDEEILDNILLEFEEKRDYYVVQQKSFFKIYQREKLCWEVSVEKVNQVFRVIRTCAEDEQKTSALNIFKYLVVIDETDVNAYRYIGNRKNYHEKYYAPMKVLHFYGVIHHKYKSVVDLLKPNFKGFDEDTYERVIIQEEENQMGLEQWC